MTMQSEKTNRQWLLARRPSGQLSHKDFEYAESPVPSAPLNVGEVRIRNLAFRCTPTMRNWMEPPGNSLHPSMSLGEPVRSAAAGYIVESANPAFKIGDRVQTPSRWQDYSTLNETSLALATKIAPGTSYLDALGRYGLNPLTAYFGLLMVGQPKSGETLVVSAAAGSTGSIAAQIGKLKGMKVIGIAGGAKKCAWLANELGIDAIDYKGEDLAKRLAELAPNGIDIFYDNVGGEVLQAAVNNMARFGRIVLCGQISAYDSSKQPEGPRNMMRLIYGSVRMQGFLCPNYEHLYAEAVEDLRAWTQSGKLIHREQILSGFESLPEAFLSLFAGSNEGTVLVKIDESAADLP